MGARQMGKRMKGRQVELGGVNEQVDALCTGGDGQSRLQERVFHEVGRHVCLSTSKYSKWKCNRRLDLDLAYKTRGRACQALLTRKEKIVVCNSARARERSQEEARGA
eukprot:280112-Pelagomonas_calceolata.AAC.4